jgi:hypothetical protein
MLMLSQWLAEHFDASGLNLIMAKHRARKARNVPCSLMRRPIRACFGLSTTPPV